MCVATFFYTSIESPCSVPLGLLKGFDTKELDPSRIPRKALSADTVIESDDHGRVVIEHVANVSLDQKNYARHSLWHHVHARAELYQYGLRPCTAWVVHWTTVKNGNPELEPNTAKYWFPTSGTVNTVYIYHYDNFRKAEIWTSENHKEDIEIPWPPATISKRKRDAGSLSLLPSTDSNSVLPTQ